jgi:hypothetical protein
MGLLVRRFHLSRLRAPVAAAVVSRVAKEAPPLSWRVFFDEIAHYSRVPLREPALRQALALSFTEAMAGATAIVATVG